jgi:hypothetical protein
MDINKSLLQQAVLRAVRSFIQAFLVVYPGQALINWAMGTGELDTNLLRAAAISGGVAVLSFLWRYLLDPSRVPSMVDAPTDTH